MTCSKRVIAAAIVATWCAAPIVDARAADLRVPFQVGEVLSYDVSWSNFVTAGRVTMRVADRQTLKDGRQGYGLQVEAQSVSAVASLYKLYYKVESVLDTASLSPIRSGSYSNEAGKVRVKSIVFGPNNTADVETRTPDISRHKVTLPPRTLDLLSAVYVMRALAARPGETLTMPVVDGETVSRLRIVFGGKETVTTGVGKRPGWRVTPMLLDERGRVRTDRRVTLWLSDDAARVPLRFESALAVGAVTLTLTK